MPFGLSVALALAAQAAGPPPDSKPAPLPAADACSPGKPDPNAQEIVICAQRPNGYRIDPDVLKARREAHNRTRPKPPNKMKDTSCTVVGPAPCMDAPMINLLGAAATMAEIAARVSRGEEVGSIFITDPQPDEYQLYKEAKARREAAQAEKAAKAKAAAATNNDARTQGKQAGAGPAPESE